MESFKEAFTEAEKKPRAYEKAIRDPNPITDGQLRYAMKVAGSIIKDYDPPPPFNRMDLFQECMVVILRALENKPELRHVNKGWMVRACHWACLSALRDLRFGKSYGKDKRYPLPGGGVFQTEWMADVHGAVHYDNDSRIDHILDKLDEKESYVAVAMACGLSKRELTKQMHASHNTIDKYQKKIQRAIDDIPEPASEARDVPQPMCRKGLHKMEGDNVVTRKDGQRHCRICARETRREYKRRKREEKRTDGAIIDSVTRT